MLSDMPFFPGLSMPFCWYIFLMSIRMCFPLNFVTAIRLFIPRSMGSWSSDSRTPHLNYIFETGVKFNSYYMSHIFYSYQFNINYVETVFEVVPLISLQCNSFFARLQLTFFIYEIFSNIKELVSFKAFNCSEAALSEGNSILSRHFGHWHFGHWSKISMSTELKLTKIWQNCSQIKISRDFWTQIYRVEVAICIKIENREFATVNEICSIVFHCSIGSLFAVLQVNSKCLKISILTLIGANSNECCP